MELRAFADQILLSAPVADKLSAPVLPWTDLSPGSAERLPLPAREPHLQFCGRRETPPMPRPQALVDPARRAVAHHIMANHELQALEVMAFILRAFPEAPPPFRQGMAQIMADEQRHTRLHIDRLGELGLQFGDIPVNGYFWKKAQLFNSLLDYLAGLPLTFEGRNLDHTIEFEDYFQVAGDSRSAGIMRAIHRDEIRHVAFGIHWLRVLKPPELTDWEAYEQHLVWPLRPGKARGDRFQREAREAAGLSPDFIDRLEDQPT